MRHLGSAGLGTVALEWGRIGCVGFGGPPTHIALLRELCVRKRGWLTGHEFEDAVAACNLLPGPASTQLAIYCAWRVRGRLGALVGGAVFVAPGLVLIIALAALFLGRSPPRWLLGAAAGAGAAVPAVAAHAGWRLLPQSWGRAAGGASRLRWLAYLVAGVASAATLGPWLVLVLLACGGIELTVQRPFRPPGAASVAPLLAGAVGAGGGLLALGWVAFKVGALSYGGGFVIVPLMQADVVSRYHWMTNTQFLNAVALGQVTPGPVSHTVAAVGYAAAGVGGALLAALVVFAPSFAFILLGGRRFDAIRHDRRAHAFLDGAAPAAIGAIFGSVVPLARALDERWQYPILLASTLALFTVRRSLIPTLLLAGAAGAAVALGGASLPS